MLSKSKIHAYDVCSILLFSLLANYIFSLRVDFSTSIDLVACVRLLILVFGASCLYWSVNIMKQAEESAVREYYAETDFAERTKFSKDDRYAYHLEPDKFRVALGIIGAAIFILLFFFLPSISLVIF